MREAERRKKKVMDKRGRDAKMAAAAQPQSRPTSTRPLPPPPPLQSRAPPPTLARPRFEPVDREKVSLSLSFLLDLFTASSNSEFTMTLWIMLTYLYRSLLISFFCVKKMQTCPLLLRVFTKVWANCIHYCNVDLFLGEICIFLFCWEKLSIRELRNWTLLLSVKLPAVPNALDG